MLYAIATLAGLGLLFGLGLGLASKKFAVEVDPRIDDILELLPGSNCGGCGLAGCSAYARAIVEQDADCGLCAQVDPDGLAQIGKIMGQTVEAREPVMAVIHCGSTYNETRMRYNYHGLRDCKAAHLAFAGAGFLACEDGCYGLGSCARACQFDAIEVLGTGAVVVNPDKCTGCGACVAVCPKDLIELIPRSAKVAVLCNTHLKGKNAKAICDVGCISCQRCAKKSDNESIVMEDNVPVVNYAIEAENEEVAGVCPTFVIIDFRKHHPIEWVAIRRKMIKQAEHEKKEKQARLKAEAARKKAEKEASNEDRPAQ